VPRQELLKAARGVIEADELNLQLIKRAPRRVSTGRRTMLFRTFALLSSLPCATAAWSFANFLQGDWDLEKIKDGKLTLAHYSLKTTPGGTLEGTFFEEDADGRSNEMRVEVEFDLAAPGTAGSFRVAKRKVFEADDNDDEPPVPKPAGELEYGEFTTLFQFDFHPRNTEHFWISESK